MKIGQYETIRLLGKGGMSEVYEVENPRLGSRHALKLFTRAYALEGEDIGDVAKKFGLSRNSVGQIKTRIEKRIVAAGCEMIAKEECENRKQVEKVGGEWRRKSSSLLPCC